MRESIAAEQIARAILILRGQRVLQDIAPSIAAASVAAASAAATALSAYRTGKACWGSNFAPALAILSSQHEAQYSRLFRS